MGEEEKKSVEEPKEEPKQEGGDLNIAGDLNVEVHEEVKGDDKVL